MKIDASENNTEKIIEADRKIDASENNTERKINVSENDSERNSDVSMKRESPLESHNLAYGYFHHHRSCFSFWSISNHVRNKMIKMKNSNGRKALTITHWNMGSTFWVNQIDEIKLLISEKQPDLAIFTEANIFKSDKDYELHVSDYSLLLPNTMDRIGNCRVAILVKDGVDVQVLNKYMEDHIASIWLKISSKGNKKIHLGAIYREHQWIRQNGPHTTKDLGEQFNRWNDFIKQWVAASRHAETVVIGDFNLNFNKWRQPDQDHLSMTELIKNNIETLSFSQIIRGDTRFWPNTTSSLIDHCWTDCPDRILRSKNSVRSYSDHNLLEFQLRISGKNNRPKEILIRDRSNMCLDRFKQNISEIDWTELLLMDNVDLAYHFLESK